MCIHDIHWPTCCCFLLRKWEGPELPPFSTQMRKDVHCILCRVLVKFRSEGKSCSSLYLLSGCQDTLKSLLSSPILIQSMFFGSFSTCEAPQS